MFTRPSFCFFPRLRGLSSPPPGEWLCWPCLRYEQEQLSRGVPQSEVRPPRWEMAAQGITTATLPGGSTAATCCLCPVKHGAFKRTAETGEWVHVACGLWHPEVTVMAGDVCNAVQGLGSIRPERVGAACSVCRLSHGAVVKCSSGHCPCMFHPLCGRRAGHYLVARLGPGSKVVYKAHCEQHSDMVRFKESDVMLRVSGVEGVLWLIELKKMASDDPIPSPLSPHSRRSTSSTSPRCRRRSAPARSAWTGLTTSTCLCPAPTLATPSWWLTWRQ